MSYIVIPDHIAFSEKISSTDKILYGVIKRYVDIGECFATNRHFSDLLRCSESTIERSIKTLVDRNFIKSKVIRKSVKTTNRILTISDSIELNPPIPKVPSKMREGGTRKNEGKVPAKMRVNITEFNNRKDLDNTNVLSLSKTAVLDQKQYKNQSKMTPSKILKIWKEFTEKRSDLSTCRISKCSITDLNNIKLLPKKVLKLKAVTSEDVEMQYHDLTTEKGFLEYFKDLCESAKNIDKKYKKFKWAIRDKTRAAYESNSYAFLNEKEKELTSADIEKILIKEMEQTNEKAVNQ